MKNALTRSAALGVATGIRSMTPASLLTWGAASGRLTITRPLDFLARPLVTNALAFCAIGELVADKLPFLPGRTQPAVLGWRVVVGGLVGGVSARSHSASPVVGGIIGAFGGAAGSYVGVAIRTSFTQRLHIANSLAGVVGDVSAVLLSLWAVERK